MAAVQSPVRVYTVMDKVLVATSPLGGVSYQRVAMPGLEDIGPHINSITGHGLIEDPTTEFRCQIILWWAYDGQVWSTPVTVGSVMGSSAGPIIHSPYTTATSFGLKMRWGLSCWNNAGSLTNRAIVSYSLAIEFKR